jgi:stage V sporulation protein R
MPRDPDNPRALPEQSEWTFDLIEQAHEEIRRVAQRYGLDTYPNQLEIITAEQMMDAYTSVGMPVSYNHWSFGKHFLSTEKSYRRGQMGLAYEIVINSNPCIAYLMEENSLTMQALVIAHAAYGHNSFFKGNYLFRSWTDADAIVDYMVFAKNYIAECEQRHGIDAVEELLDSCHALQNHGVDRYKRPAKLSVAQEAARTKEREDYAQSQVNAIWRTLPLREEQVHSAAPVRFPPEPEENLLYFIEKYAPLLEPWQRTGAHHAQDLAILLSSAPDPGHERRLGHVLALHDFAGPVPGRHRRRWLHARIPAKPHQCRLPAAGQQSVLQRDQPVCARLCDDERHPPHL